MRANPTSLLPGTPEALPEQRADAAWFGLDFDAAASAREATELLEQAQSSADHRLLAGSLAVLAWAAGSKRQALDLALARAHRARRAAEAAGARDLMPRVHSATAIVLGALGDRAGRFEELEAMRRSSAELGDAFHEALALHDLGLGFDRPELLEQALELSESLPQPRMLLIANLLHSAARRLREGEVELPLARCERAWTLAERAPSPAWQVEALRILALARARAGRRAASLSALAALHAHAAARPAVAAIAAARVQAALGRRRAAIAAYERCLTHEDSPRLLLDAARELAPLLARGRLWQRAYACRLRADELRGRIEHDDNERRLHGLQVQHRLELQEERTRQEQQRNRELAAMVEQLERANREITELSERDALTGLFNRRRADAELERALTRVQRGEDPLSLALFDLDHFKAINDRFGHAIGDEVLRRVARLVGSELRGADLAARWGGEEFVLLLPGARLDAALLACERIRRCIESHGWAELEAGLQVTASFGVAEAAAGLDADQLRQAADRCLYRAKHAGRNRVVG